MTPQIMQSARERIAQQTAEYLAAGKQIQHVAAGWESEGEWIDTAAACALIGVTAHKLNTWIATNASLPRSKSNGGENLWYKPSVEAFARIYKGKRKGKKS